MGLSAFNNIKINLIVIIWYLNGERKYHDTDEQLWEERNHDFEL